LVLNTEIALSSHEIWNELQDKTLLRMDSARALEVEKVWRMDSSFFVKKNKIIKVQFFVEKKIHFISL